MLEGAPNPAQEDCVTVGFVVGDIVLRLCSTLPKQLTFKVYFDKYFTFVEVLMKLKEWGMWAIDTLRQDHIRGCALKNEKD